MGRERFPRPWPRHARHLRKPPIQLCDGRGTERTRPVERPHHTDLVYDESLGCWNQGTGAIHEALRTQPLRDEGVRCRTQGSCNPETNRQARPAENECDGRGAQGPHATHESHYTLSLWDERDGPGTRGSRTAQEPPDALPR